MLTESTLERPSAIEVRRRYSYPADDLGFLQRTHPLRGRPFGQLIYMADSVMQPMRRPGFGMHPHVNVEVVSFVVDGELTHRDSAGNVGVVPAGGLQRITAGTGIMHDESNRTDRPLRMFQIWFAPSIADVDPHYELIKSAGEVPSGALRQFVGDEPDALSLNADAAISLGRLETGRSLTIEAEAGRAYLLYLVEGGAAVNGERLTRQDHVRFVGPVPIEVTAAERTDLMLIDSAI